jgi:hypothetical protein
MAQDHRVRRYTRYAFSADASIIDDAGHEIPAHVTDISFGGCRLCGVASRISVDEFRLALAGLCSNSSDIFAACLNRDPSQLCVRPNFTDGT